MKDDADSNSGPNPISWAIPSSSSIKVAGHNWTTVVAIDAAETNPYETDTIVIAPPVDALMTADANPGLYYLAASPYESAAGLDTLDRNP